MKESQEAPKKDTETQHLPTVSNLQVLLNSRKILKNPLPFHHKNFKRHGNTFKVKVGSQTSVVFTRDPELIKHVLQKQHKHYHKSALQTRDLAKYIGHGILTSNGEHWRTHRRMIQPAFHKKKLLGLMEIMHEAIRFELQSIQTEKVQDIFPLMGDLAFQVVAKSLFSRADIRKRMARLKYMTETNQQMLIKEMRQPYLNWWFHISGKIKRHLRLAEDARTLLNAIIEERIVLGEDKDDLLDMLLKARYEDGTAMSRKQLIDEVLILFAAGHETTANTLSFTLYLLAKHPEIQQKAYQEASSVNLGNHDLMTNIMQLPYIKQCIEEAMRLYPPAYIIDRVTIANDRFKAMLFPEDTMILMSIYELHRSPDFWETPLEFRPERFAVEDKKVYSDYYYPFGAGPRMCVGNNFAMYEMVMAIAEVVKSYSISTPMEAVEINPLISMKPKTVPLRFTARK
ncbi:cytochrome P450 [Spongiimicrobium salis]|uniref:cytochrome P450 n=1 Tax=Spongiimicrobium salis TaxID=1667022 RepID=UPI00374CEFC4